MKGIVEKIEMEQPDRGRVLVTIAIGATDYLQSAGLHIEDELQFEKEEAPLGR